MTLVKRAVVIFAVSLIFSCIALKKDVDLARSEMTAENNAKFKVLQDSTKTEMEKISRRLDEIEKTLQIDKKAAENKISLSFSTLDELKSTIREINNRIDTVDVTAQKGGNMAQKIEEIEKALRLHEEELTNLRKEVLLQLDELKPVENMTVTENGAVRLPEDEDKSYKQLVDFTRSATDGNVARKGWTLYAGKWPKSRRCDVVYWTGESYFLEKAYNNAIEFFGRIESEFPKCSKLEASYIRTAYSLFYTGKADVSLKILEVMDIKFPKSSFSSQIKELRKMIKAGKGKQKNAKKEKNQEKGEKK